MNLIRQIRKYIYFPSSYDDETDPFVIHVQGNWDKEWRGCRDAKELLEGRFEFYPMKRCQPYTDQLWQACEAWKRRRVKLAEDFKYLMEKGVSSGSET